MSNVSKQNSDFGPHEARVFLRQQGVRDIPSDDVLAPMCAALLHIFHEIKTRDYEIHNLRSEVKKLYNKLNASQKSLDRSALKIEALNDLVETDSLTGVANRRGFEKNLKGMIDRRSRNDEGQSAESKLPVATILFIDVNDFKRFNESYSHVMGDGVLTFVASVLEKHTRRGDYLARVGGDEFALVLYGADSAKAEKIGKKIMKSIIEESYNILPEGGISVTYGAHQVTPEDDAETILASMSKNMSASKSDSKKFARDYVHKRAGRSSTDDICPS